MRYQINIFFFSFRKNLFNILTIIFCTILFLFSISAKSIASTRSSNTRIQTDQWAIKISPTIDPDLIARDMGAINLGQIANLKDTYLFTIPHSSSLTQNTNKRIKKNRSIIWFQQQVKRWRFPRRKPYFEDPLFPEQWHLSNIGQHGGTQEEDVNIIPAWDKGLSGEGVIIGIVDDGLQHEHPDLILNYIANLSYDFNDHDFDPSPFLGNYYISGDSHGTSVAGVSAARENNNSCGVGAAYRANLAGLRLLASEVSDADEAECLSYKRDEIHIYNNSWGPADGEGLEGPGPLTIAAIKDNINNGRNGFGNIYVFASGNGLQQSDNVNYDGYANLRYVIAVSAVNQYGQQSYYSEPGACILVCAPSDGRSIGIYTTDLMGQNGYDLSGDCTGSFGGTSSAAPLVSGIIALILEKNPNLYWRDVKHILVKSADKNDPSDYGWVKNGAGLFVNHKYGFGRINANRAVVLAENWKTVSKEISIDSGKLIVNQEIPSDNTFFLKTKVDIKENISIEHVEVILTIDHDCPQQLEIILTSPDGTNSVLAENHNANTPYDEWMLTSVRHWGENSSGTWSLEINDKVLSCKGSLSQWQLILHGEEQGEKVNQPPVVISDSLYTTKNKQIDIFPLSNDFDPDHDSLKIVSVSTPVNGKIISYTDEHITYLPNIDFIGIEKLNYEVTDSFISQTGEIIIYIMDRIENNNNNEFIIPDNNPIGVTSEILISSGNQIQTIDVHVNLEHDNLENINAYLISPDNTKILLFSNLASSQTDLDIHLTNIAKESISIANPPFNGNYLPKNSLDILKNNNASGRWQLLVIDDESGDTGSLKSWDISIIFSSSGQEASPIARSDQVQVYPNSSACINVLENDTDPDGQALSIISTAKASHGIASIESDCGIMYRPDSDFSGLDNLTYTVKNEKGLTASAEVEIIVSKDLALYFNGIDDNVSCGTPVQLNITDYITIEAWIKPSNFGELEVQGFGRIIDKANYILFLNETGRDDYADYSLMFAIKQNYGDIVMANTPKNSIKLNEWQHIAASYDSSINTLNIYINGQKQKLTFPFQGPYGKIDDNKNNNFFIGESDNKDRAFKGMIDEIRIWKTVRTESDIVSHMNSSFANIPDDIVAYWPMREKNTYLKDYSSNKLNCRIESPVWTPGLIVPEAEKIWAVTDNIYALVNTPKNFNPTDNDGLSSTPVDLALTPIKEIENLSGKFSILSDFSVIYTPNSGFIGTDIYQYTVTTHDGQKANSSIYINVVNDFSLYFENRIDYIDLGNSEKWNLEGPMTIQAWIKPVDTAPEEGEQLDYILDKRVFSLFINHLNNINYLDNSLVYWSLQTNGQWYAVSTNSYSIKWNQWQHIAVFDDSKGNIQIFLNGEKMELLKNGLLDFKRADHRIYPLILGNAQDLQHGFQGWLDEVMIWSEVRTQEEIQKSMYACFLGRNSNLLAYWPSTKTSQTLIDRSLNDFHGSIYGPKFQPGVLSRYPLSLESLISSLALMSGFSSKPICVEDIQNDLIFGTDDLLNLFNKIAE